MTAESSGTEEARPCWYLVQCKPREDERALEHLGRQGFQCYRPTRKVERLHQGKSRFNVESLFPGYLFIHLDRVKDNWHPIRSTRGVNRIVTFGLEPTPVADEIVDGIQTRLAASPGGPQPRFSAGDRVLITEGAFADLEAIFVSNEGDQRVSLLLNILQSSHLLSFPAASVCKV